MPIRPRERHRTDRIGWLRAAVLGANDGIVSTASLVLGVAAAHSTHSNIMVAGIAGLMAGATSMAAGEYVSVHSQADTEGAELARERAELAANGESETEELTAIYIDRGLDPALATQVAEQLMAHDAIGAHARDELGITETLSARPIQAGLVSACSFAVGAALPLMVAAIVSEARLIPVVAATSLVFLATLGGFAAHTGGADVKVGAFRVLFWGALAMASTAGVGAIWNRRMTALMNKAPTRPVDATETPRASVMTINAGSSSTQMDRGICSCPWRTRDSGVLRRYR